MPDKVYPIIVNQNPVPPKQKPKIPFKKFFVLIVVFLLLSGSWYLIQNKPWQKIISSKETGIKEGKLESTHPEIWMVVLELDTTVNKAQAKGDPRIYKGDLPAISITEKLKSKEGEWSFQVVIEDKEGKILYSSYRTVSILPLDENPNIWEFGVATPYIKGSILVLYDLDGNQFYSQLL